MKITKFALPTAIVLTSGMAFAANVESTCVEPTSLPFLISTDTIIWFGNSNNFVALNGVSGNEPELDVELNSDGSMFSFDSVENFGPQTLVVGGVSSQYQVQWIVEGADGVDSTSIDFHNGGTISMTIETKLRFTTAGKTCDTSTFTFTVATNASSGSLCGAGDAYVQDHGGWIMVNNSVTVPSLPGTCDTVFSGLNSTLNLGSATAQIKMPASFAYNSAYGGDGYPDG